MSNKEWRDFFAERLNEMQTTQGWDGVFLDNVDASLARFRRNNLTLPVYSSDADFQAATEEMLAYLYLNYYQPTGRLMFGNITYLENDVIWYRYLKYLDGAMLEDFAVGWNSDYKDPQTWEWQMNLIEGAQDMGKDVILVSQGQQSDLQREEFAFASYLLINQGKAYSRYTNSDAYHDAWIYDNYRIDLGQPLGKRYVDGNEWKRDFEKGTVIVNPTELTSQIVTK